MSTALPAALPVTQLNALPVVNIQQYQDAQGATGIIMGGQNVKHWTPAALGIVAADPALVGIKWCLVSNWLDLATCIHFMLVINRVVGGAITAIPAMSVQAQMRLSTAETPSACYSVGGAIHDELFGIYNLHTTAITFGAANAIGETQRAAVGWGPPVPAAVPMQAIPVTIGENVVRLILSWSTNDPHGGGHTDTFTASLWGRS